MSKEKQKGTTWESAIRDYLKDEFPDVDRLVTRGKNDVGDVNVAPWVCIEAKNQQRMELATWVDEANREGKNRNSWLNVAWHHRPRKASPGDGYVTMSGDTFKRLLAVIQTVYDEQGALEQVVKTLEEL